MIVNPHIGHMTALETGIPTSFPALAYVASQVRLW
jgi:hypothetical protein